MGKDIELAILFADVVGSTRLYELMGDLRARDMVAICIDVMRSATEQRQGTVIKTMGDEVMATFPSADEALNAAAQMQQQISTPCPAQGRRAAGRDPHRLPLRARGAGEPRCLRRDRAHRQSHDQPGQGRADHHDRGDRRAPLAGMAGRRAGRSMSRTIKGQGNEVAALRGAVADGGRHQHGARDRAERAQGRAPLRLRLRWLDREVVVDEQHPSVTIGRAEDNDVVVKGNLISRLHARIELSRNKLC